jgi:serine/threonine protein kinase
VIANNISLTAPPTVPNVQKNTEPVQEEVKVTLPEIEDNDDFIPSKDVEFVAPLGEGSYGTVWKAVWHGVGGGSVIAVKKLHLTAMSEQLKSDLQKEMKIMR